MFTSSLLTKLDTAVMHMIACEEMLHFCMVHIRNNCFTESAIGQAPLPAAASLPQQLLCKASPLPELQLPPPSFGDHTRQYSCPA
mmetsp:Transcript_39946/g.118931  ORF Transcript_39946/g.118931 Transcript_39946/m.118931 type:complete len:85 (+) Transcript_39946:1304-1558(+)